MIIQSYKVHLYDDTNNKMRNHEASLTTQAYVTVYLETFRFYHRIFKDQHVLSRGYHGHSTKSQQNC